MNIELTLPELEAVLGLIEAEIDDGCYGFSGRYRGRLKRAKEKLANAKDQPKQKQNQHLTKTMKVLLESLKEGVYDGSWTEIYPNEFMTAKALERRGLIEVEGMLARVKEEST